MKNNYHNNRMRLDKYNSKDKYRTRTIISLIILFILYLFLGGCANRPSMFDGILPVTEKIITKTVTKYPEFPPVSHPPNMGLIPFEWDYPRMRDSVVVKNISKCLDVPTKERDKSFWKKCGVNQLDTTSNLYIGMSEENYRLFINNWNQILGREKQWRAIIKEVNRMREELKKSNSDRENKLEK
jgi:hypothetical protein